MRIRFAEPTAEEKDPVREPADIVRRAASEGLLALMALHSNAIWSGHYGVARDCETAFREMMLGAKGGVE